MAVEFTKEVLVVCSISLIIMDHQATLSLSLSPSGGDGFFLSGTRSEARCAGRRAELHQARGTGLHNTVPESFNYLRITLESNIDFVMVSRFKLTQILPSIPVIIWPVSQSLFANMLMFEGEIF